MSSRATRRKTEAEQRRKWRSRKVSKKAAEKNNRPRLSVFRSSMHIYAQVIDDTKGVTIVAASTMDTDLKSGSIKTSTKDAAAAVGKLVAERAIKAGIKEVAFDRGACKYHGRVEALANSAREAGLDF